MIQIQGASNNLVVSLQADLLVVERVRTRFTRACIAKLSTSLVVCKEADGSRLRFASRTDCVQNERKNATRAMSTCLLFVAKNFLRVALLKACGLRLRKSRSFPVSFPFFRLSLLSKHVADAEKKKRK